MDKDVEEANKSDDPLGALMERRKNKGQSFNSAFREAREAGDKTFYWNGKKYTTELSKPQARPAVSDTYREEGVGRGKPMPPSRASATKMMADRAASEAAGARAASEARAAAARGAESEKRRESRGQERDDESTSGMGPKITNRPAPGARSIYEDLDLGKVAGAAGAIASAYPAGRLAKTGIDALKAARAGRAARAAKEMEDRVEPSFKRGGMVKPRGSGCARKGFGKGTMR